MFSLSIHSSITEWKEFFKKEESDEYIYNEIQDLRAHIEDLQDWIAIKSKAKKELKDIPPDILPLLVDRFQPYLHVLPAGHGIGHFTRGIMYVDLILQDPKLYDENPVEIFVGIIAAIFHDVGNSVIERYDEDIRFTGHAEAGAFLFGYLATDIIPPNMLQLIKFVIAAHTNYLQDLVITKYKGTEKEITKVRKPYKAHPVYSEGSLHKVSSWIAQATDRMDAFSAPMVTRHIMTKAVPTRDFSSHEFHQIHQDQDTDFRHQFAPILRTKEYRQALTDVYEKTTRVLEHFYTFAENAITSSPYSRYDTQYYFFKLLQPHVTDQLRFISNTSALSQALSQKSRSEAMEKFMKLCEILEPAKNIKHIEVLLIQKFALLSQANQDNWAYGFLYLSDVIYPRWYTLLSRQSEIPIAYKHKILSEIILCVNAITKKLVPAFHPQFLINKPLDLFMLLKEG